jgi:hypothetical protein
VDGIWKETYVDQKLNYSQSFKSCVVQAHHAPARPPVLHPLPCSDF